MPDLSERQLAYLTEVDHRDHEALLALDPDDNAIGVSRFVRLDDDVAEFAIVVADAWQGRGLGTELLDRLVDRAREEGVRRFSAVVLAENAEALALLERLGDASRRAVGPQVEVDVALPAPGRQDDRFRALLRAAAAGTVVTRGQHVASGGRLRLPPARPRPGRAGQRDRRRGQAGGRPRGGGGGPSRRRAAATARDAHLHLVAVYRPLTSDRDEASDRLDTAAADLRREGLEVTVHLRSGEAADAIIDVAEENAAALIVVGPEPPGGLMPWRAYSLPDRVCARAPCDVLIAR